MDRSAGQRSPGRRRPVSTDRADPRLVLIGLGLATLLSVVVPVALVSQVPDEGRSLAWPWTLALTAYAGLRLAVLVARGRQSMFDFFVMLFVYIFMGLGPTVQMRSDRLSLTTPGMDYALDLPTAHIVWLGVATYEVGRLTAAWLSARRGVDPTAEPAPVTGVTMRRSIALVAFGLLLSAYYLNAVGPAAILSSRDAAYEARSAAWADPAVRSIVYALAIYPLLVGVGALAQLRRRAGGSSRRWLTVVAVLAVAVLAVVVNPISSARYTLGTVCFAVAVYFGALATRARTRLTMLAALGGFVFLFPLADAFRRPEGVDLARAGFFEEYAGNPDYDSFWQVANAWSFTVDGFVEPGRQALGVLLFWVPRALWPDKPVDTGILLAQYRGYTVENLSAPLWAELLVNGGLLGVGLGFLLVGALLHRLDRRLPPAFEEAGFYAIVGAILPVYMTILMRGSLLQATGSVVVATACLLAVRSRRPTPSDPRRTGPTRTPLRSTAARAAARPSSYSGAHGPLRVPGDPTPVPRRGLPAAGPPPRRARTPGSPPPDPRPSGARRAPGRTCP